MTQRGCIPIKAIGWLLIFIGIGAGIDAYHGNSPYASLSKYLAAGNSGVVNTVAPTNNGS